MDELHKKVQGQLWNFLSPQQQAEVELATAQVKADVEEYFQRHPRHGDEVVVELADMIRAYLGGSKLSGEQKACVASSIITWFEDGNPG
jgi:hypothetical protein